jgi:hypothetical protein
MQEKYMDLQQQQQQLCTLEHQTAHFPFEEIQKLLSESGT